jgi:hypothetical protein
MNSKLNILLFAAFFIVTAEGNSQDVLASAGGNAAGQGGSASYTVGQIFFANYNAANLLVSEGVQQPVEIYTLSNTVPLTPIGVKVYPNPADNAVFLVLNQLNSETINYNLVDINGKLLKKGELSSLETAISLDKLPSGIYILHVTNTNKSKKQSYKIIKN